MSNDAETMAARFREAGIIAEAGPGGAVIITASDLEAAAILAYLGDILVNVADQQSVNEHARHDGCYVGCIHDPGRLHPGEDNNPRTGFAYND